MSNMVPMGKLMPRLENPSATVADALEKIRCNFEVTKEPVFVMVENAEGKLLPTLVPGHRAIVKDDNTPIAVVGDRYGIIQYEKAVDFLNQLVADRKVQIYGGCSTDKGARMHLLVKVPDTIELSPGEKFDCFYTVSATHDGSGCLQAMCSPIHNVSQTVFTPTGKGVVRIKHSVNAELRLKQAERMFAKLNHHFVDFGRTVKDMVGIKMREQQARDFFFSLVDGDHKRSENVRNKLFDIYAFSGLCRNLSSCKDTLFGAFMAVQQYADYYKTVRKSIRRDELDAKIEARLTGDAAKMKAESFSMALAIVQQFS